MGNLIADAILDRTKDQGVTVAIQNGGGIRASIDGGPVTMGEVLTVLPFQNTIATFQLSGKDLMDSLEAGLSEIEEGKGKFPQVAGIKYSFDKSVAPNQGRLKSVEVKDGAGWTSLDPAKTYTIATNNFVRTGGDGYKLFADKAQNPYDFGPSLEQVLADYVTAHSPYTPSLDGRITLAQATTSQPPASTEPAATPAPAQPSVAEKPAESTVPAPATPPADLTPPSTTPETKPTPATTTQTPPEPSKPAQSSATTEPAAKPSITAGSSHTIAQGDTLWDIAEAAYGDGTKWRRIARANPGVQAHRLLVGKALTIPAAH